ncbi:MAG: hypothetical protein IJ702_02435, partial [Fretibacterium sp.]|nr:hypothetical protein [Fretibacterium sp.]
MSSKRRAFLLAWTAVLAFAGTAFAGLAPVSLSHLAGNPPRAVSVAADEDLPVSFDLRDEGRVTPVKNQGSFGSCWTFATMAACESNVLSRFYDTKEKREAALTDVLLSEMHLAWFSFVNPDEWKVYENPALQRLKDGVQPTAQEGIQGGGAPKAVAFLSRLDGPVASSAVPYPTATTKYAVPTVGERPSGYERAFDLRDAMYLAPVDGRTQPDREVLQRIIRKHGAVAIGYYENQESVHSPHHSYLKEDGTSGDAYYYPGDTPYNHEVAVVGWDDNFPVTSFDQDQAPEKPGAWLIRNSWGTATLDKGYFWLSYEQGIDDGTAFVLEKANPNLRHYGYDPLGWVMAWGDGEKTAWAANVFRVRDSGEKLTRVGFYTTDNNAKYTVSVYDLGTEKPAASPVGDTPLVTLRDEISYAGYHTVNLDNDVDIEQGHYFSIVVKLENPAYDQPIAVEVKTDGYSRGSAVFDGESFFSADGTTWEDGATHMETDEDEGEFLCPMNACIKAFTLAE